LQHFHLRAIEESGAINLVSAIYLGYRAFDTLGETIVLVLSVAGVLLVSGVRQ
jgi:multicomponent Na+:H+ antiporter subunit B